MSQNDNSKPDRREALDQIMGRDGFSPDLPADFATRGDNAGLSWGLRLLMYMMSGVKVGTLDIVLPNGSTRRFEGSEPGPHGLWQIKSERLMRHLLTGGEVGIGDAYLDDCWDSPDLTRLLMVMYLNEPHYKGPFEINWLGRFWGMVKHKLKANTKRTAKKNIEYHYDLGNEFYKMWLDDTMAYSSGMYIQPNETLMDAQINKFQLMFERLDLRPEHTLLEIGSGWGGFAIYAAKHSGCRVHSITLSNEQYAEAKIRAEGREPGAARDLLDARGALGVEPAARELLGRQGLERVAQHRGRHPRSSEFRPARRRQGEQHRHQGDADACGHAPVARATCPGTPPSSTGRSRAGRGTRKCRDGGFAHGDQRAGEVRLPPAQVGQPLLVAHLAARAAAAFSRAVLACASRRSTPSTRSSTALRSPGLSCKNPPLFCAANVLA